MSRDAEARPSARRAATESADAPRGMPARATRRPQRRITPPPASARRSGLPSSVTIRSACRRRARAGARSAAPCDRRAAARPPRRPPRRSPGRDSPVGSSRTTSGASRRNARASAIRWRCAGRQRPPAVADDRLVAVRAAADERVGARERGGLAHALVVGGPVAEPDVVGDGATEERRLLRHPGDLRPPRGRRRSRRDRSPPTVTRPRVGLREAAGGARRSCSCRRRSGRRARPSRPARAPGRPRRARARPRRVGERDALEPDRQRHAGSAGTRRPARDGRRRPRRGRAAARRRPAPSALAWNWAARFRSGR